VAGVDRQQLFEQSEKRLALRVHDLRATFVTVSLASGKSEAWVMDRTGHRSSQMVNLYRRQARMLEEVRIGSLSPLSEALPELRTTVGEDKSAG
jgi:integrase